MGCPVAHTGFARLPGQVYDDSARKLRRQILEGRIDLDRMLRECDAHKNAPRSHEVLGPQSYATASIVIDHYWEYVKGYCQYMPMPEMNAEVRNAPHNERVREFMRCYLEFLKQTQVGYAEKIFAQASQPTADDEAKIFLWHNAVFTEDQKLSGAPMISMVDLVTLFGQFATVAVPVFERDIGRTPTRAELSAMLRSLSVIKTLLEVMQSSREATHPLMALLEKNPNWDPNTPMGEWKPEFFEIHRDTATHALRIKPAIVAFYRRWREGRVATREKDRVLGCPVLYTGKFKEMYNWLFVEFEKWN